MPVVNGVYEPSIEQEKIICPVCYAEIENESEKKSLEGVHGRDYDYCCESCYSDNVTRCYDCSEKTWGELEYSNPNGDLICSDCDDQYSTCPDCDERYHNDDMRNCDGDYLCESCRDVRMENEEEEEQSIIKNYSYRPNPIFHGRQSKYFMGIELEIECRNTVTPETKAEEIQNVLPDVFAYMKADSSLTRGFEVVTHPATLEIQKAMWEKFFAKLPTRITSWNSGRCGLHVHMNREALSDLQIAKMLVFVNSITNRNMIAKIAGRSDSEWSRFKDKKIGGVSKGGKIVPNYSRYEAINLQNTETIEFRMFRGTLKKSSFLRAVEFCEALALFCSPAEHSILDCQSKEKFLSYIFAGKSLISNLPNKNRYENLCQFLTAKGFYNPK